jgi:hypothetical protein
MDEELDRLSTSFAGILEQRTRQLQQRVDAFSGALERFSDRISNTINTIVAALPGSSSTAAPAAGGATSTGSIQLVRVMNETNQPIPVRVVESVARREESQGGGGFFGNLLGGIGSFVGNLVGGVASGFISPFAGIAVGAELVIAIGLLIPVVNRAAEIVADFRLLVEDIRTFTNQLIAGIRGLIQGLFDNLTTAGILPVSRLLASLLIFIDAGIRLIFTYVQPLLNWVGQLLTALADWLGQLINRLSQWVQGVINTLPNFLAALLGFILETVVRPALRVFVDEAVRTALTSAARFFKDVFLTLADILREVITHGITLLEIAIANLVNSLISALNGVLSGLNSLIRAIPGVGPSLPSIPSISLVSVPTAPGALGPRLSSIIESRFPAAPAAPPGSGGPVGPTTAPKLTLPGFRSPTLNTPEFRAPTESALEDILRPRSTTETAALTTAGSAGAAGVAGGAAAGITVNDGIHVQITAERVERDNADETARLIADRVLEEIQRRIELGRFRRGLSTGTLQ